MYPWLKSKSLEAGEKLTNKGLQWQCSAYSVLLAKFHQLTQPAYVQILSNASCTSEATISVITCVLPMYAVLYALFPSGFLTRLETRQLMSQRQHYYRTSIADAARRYKWWRQVTSFGVESGALLWSARTHTHTHLPQTRAVAWLSTRGAEVFGACWCLDTLLDAPVSTGFHNQQYSEYLNWCHSLLLYFILKSQNFEHKYSYFSSSVTNLCVNICHCAPSTIRSHTVTLFWYTVFTRLFCAP